MSRKPEDPVSISKVLNVGMSAQHLILRDFKVYRSSWGGPVGWAGGAMQQGYRKKKEGRKGGEERKKRKKANVPDCTGHIEHF